MDGNLFCGSLDFNIDLPNLLRPSLLRTRILQRSISQNLLWANKHDSNEIHSMKKKTLLVVNLSRIPCSIRHASKSLLIGACMPCAPCALAGWPMSPWACCPLPPKLSVPTDPPPPCHTSHYCLLSTANNLFPQVENLSHRTDCCNGNNELLL